MDLENLDLPTDWQMKPIRDAYAFTKKPRNLSVRHGDTVPFLPMKAIPTGHIFVSEYEERLGVNTSSGTYIESGDLLVAKITPSFENGKQAIVKWKQPFGFATTEVIPIQEVAGMSDKFFLFHLLLHPAIRSDLAGKMDGTTGRQRLSKEVLGSHLIPLPPLPEQRKIAAVLSLVQRAIEQQERLIALTMELKKALMQKLFTEGLRGEPQKQTEIGPVPQSWEIVKLGTLVNFETGKLDSNAAIPFGAYPFFTCSQETLRIDHYAFDTEAILLSGNNARAIYSVKHHKGKFNAYQRTYVITLKNGDLLPYEFLLYALSRNLERLRTLSIGTSTKYLTLGLLKNLEIVKPPFGEAQEVGDHLSLTDKKIETIRQKKGLLSDLFRTLLHQLMTAQLRVNDLDLSELEATTKE